MYENNTNEILSSFTSQQVDCFESFIDNMEILLQRYGTKDNRGTKGEINYDLLSEIISLSHEEPYREEILSNYGDGTSLSTGIRNYYNQTRGHFSRYLGTASSYFEFLHDVRHLTTGKGRLYGNKHRIFTTFYVEDSQVKLSFLTKLTENSIQFVIIFFELQLGRKLSLKELSYYIPFFFGGLSVVHEGDALKVIESVRPLLMPIPDKIYVIKTSIESIRARYRSHSSLITNSEKIWREIDKKVKSLTT
jgi:hypothetical protein